MSDYRMPPITEAVIEMRSASNIPDDLVDKAARAIKKRYPSTQELREFSVKIGDPDSGANTRIGHKLATPDGAFIAQVRRYGLAFSSMAPYPGWTTFTSEFDKVWAQWKKATEAKKIDRIGIRFINRIDIPYDETTLLDSDDYLSVGVRLPAPTGNVAMAWQIVSECPVENTPFNVIIRAGSAESALLGFASYNLDLDLHCSVDVPQTHTDISSLLDQAKSAKNRVFEACITDRTRALLS